MAGLLAGDPRAVVETEQAVATAEHAGLGWLARVGRAALSIAGTPAGAEYARSDATAVREAAAHEEDRWGEGLAALAEGWAALGEPEAALEPLEAAATRFRALGAGSLEAWARGLSALALARAGAPDAREAARPPRRSRARPASRSWRRSPSAPWRSSTRSSMRSSAPPPTASSPTPASPCPAGGRSGAAGDVAEAGPRWPIDRRRRRTAAGSIRVQLFGAFAMAIDGRPVDLAGLKPRPRAVLRFLALNAGRPVHREVLQETFWPEADPETGARSLHVALSALRRELTPRAGRGACELLVRDGDAYRLALPDGSRIDLVEFERAVVDARTIRARGGHADGSWRPSARCSPRTAAISCPRTGRRSGRRAGASEREPRPSRRPTRWPRLLLEGDPEGAAEACAAGLALDSHHDPLWRLLVEARERAGDQAAATSARSGYARMLADLGVASGDGA